MSSSNLKFDVLFGVVPTGCGCSCEGQVLDGCYSPVFRVTDKPVVIRGYNLENEVIVVEAVAGPKGGEYFAPVKNSCGCKITLDPCNCEIVLTRSGCYRLNRCDCIDGDTPLGDPYVEYTENQTESPITGDQDMAGSCGCCDSPVVTTFTKDAQNCITGFVQTQDGATVDQGQICDPPTAIETLVVAGDNTTVTEAFDASGNRVYTVSADDVCTMMQSVPDNGQTIGG